MPDLVPGCSGWGTRPPNGCVVHSLPSRGERVSWPSTITMTNSEVAAAFHYFRLHGNFFSAHDRAQASITSGPGTSVGRHYRRASPSMTVGAVDVKCTTFSFIAMGPPYPRAERRRGHHKTVLHCGAIQHGGRLER